MTELRDATREAAYAAAQPARRRRWPRMGGQRLRWGAALATVALAVSIAVLWQGRPAPGPGRERVPVAAVPAPAAAPASAAAPDAAAGATALPVPRPARPAEPASAPAAPASAPPVALPPPRAREPARPAPASSSAVRAAPPVVAAAPATPSAPAALRDSPASLPWTQVRIEAGGSSMVVSRMQAGELPALVTSMLASPSDETEGAAPAALRLELAQGDEAIGALELVGERWRWTTLRDARQARLLRPEAGVSAALREEAQRLLAR
jgi:hypothetical protein